ncbi:MarR family winged helix-turn-helix transcriptional regulator [Streptomyces sp. enrichment culture]|uniref:MarR family winged helix-turn-helix transcriptional regulator n=1 Tax=Streptomyces sp. enrichment culture TaxID=1795815 RepID=UPI003F56F66D
MREPLETAASSSPAGESFEAPPSMKSLAARLYCNAPNLSFVMNQLTDRGLVERSADPSDRRSRVVALTEDGRRVRSAVIDATLALTPFAGLTDDELRQLVQLLGKALGRGGTGGPPQAPAAS